MDELKRLLEIFNGSAKAAGAAVGWRMELDAAFVFDSGLEIHDRESFLARLENHLPWQDIRVLAITWNDRETAFLFEFTDPVTALYHRASWFMRCTDVGKIVRILAAEAIVPRPE